MENSSLTPSPESPPARSGSPSPPASPPTSTASLVTGLVVQLAALATVFRSAPRCVDACLQSNPPPLAWKMLLGMAAVIAIVAAPTPSLRAALSTVTRFLPGGGGNGNGRS